MWNEVAGLFQDFMGTGLAMIWFVLSLAYLWVREKERHIRILLLYMPIIVLLLYFNPLFASLMYAVVGEEIYYRVLWLLPVTVVIAYASARLCGEVYEREKSAGGKRPGWKKAAAGGTVAVFLAGGITICGRYIYDDPNYVKAQNLYHVPDSVVHICDAINVPGREVMAVFPLELVQYVRQYSPVTCMPYGREMMVARWNNSSPLCEAMEADVIEMERLAALVREADCHFCILRADKQILGEPEDYGWILVGEIDGFLIYRDPARELYIPEL